jgi:hypothetical protein
MLRSVRSRLRLLVGVLGCAVLVTSLISWAHSLHAAAGQLTWVKIDPSRAPQAETAELWRVSASCVRPYFVRALLRSKAKLAAHYNAAPDEVRARLNVGAAPGHAVEPAAWHPTQSGNRKEAAGRDPYGEYVAALQVKYAEWYAALFKLEIQAGNWQQRLIDVADQTMVVSAASRASFGAYARGGIRLTSAEGDFDGYLLTALGLGGFSSDEQTSLKSTCLTIDPVVQSFRNPRALGALWQWPLDCLAEFSFGLELVLISMFFAPIAVWIGTGDLEVKPQIRSLRSHFATGIRDLHKSKLVYRVLKRSRHIYVASLASLAAIKPHPGKWAAGNTVSRRPDSKRGGRPAGLSGRSDGNAVARRQR